MTRFDVRLLSGGYILPIIGIAAWAIGVIAPFLAWLTGTPIFNRTTEQSESAFSLATILSQAASAAVGTILIMVGASIRRAYRNGRRSGF